MTDIARDRAWRAALAAAYERRRKREGGELIDVDELIRSPEAMAAIGLTSALIDVCTSPASRRALAEAAVDGDLLGFEAAGHDGPLTGIIAPTDAPTWAESDGAQKHYLHWYCGWRSAGGNPSEVPSSAVRLDWRLRAVANAADKFEVSSLAVELGQGVQVARRLREYREIGRRLLAEDPGLGDTQSGPLRAKSLLPRRSWQPEPVAEAAEDLAPVAEEAAEIAPLVMM